MRLQAAAGDDRLLDHPLARVRLGGRHTRDKPVRKTCSPAIHQAAHEPIHGKRHSRHAPAPPTWGHRMGDNAPRRAVQRIARVGREIRGPRRTHSGRPHRRLQSVARTHLDRTKGQRAGRVYRARTAIAECRATPYAHRRTLGPGIGRRGLACVETARDLGYERMVLFTSRGLNSARRLYEAEGFQLTSEEEQDLWGEACC